MNQNSSDQLTTCQADQPEYLTVCHDGQEYRLKWEAGKRKYRLHLRHLPTLRDTYYGPDPDDALRRAADRLPQLLALAVRSAQPVDKKPKHLLLSHKGIEYKLTLHKTGEYRRKFKLQDKYFGDTPEVAKDDFYTRIDGLLAGKDPRFTPADGQVIDEANPTFNQMVDDALAYRKSRVGIDLGQDRYDNLKTRFDKLKECAAAVEGKCPTLVSSAVSRKPCASEFKAKHLEDLIDKLRESHNLTTLDDDLQFLRFIFSRANRRMKSDQVELIIKETLASVPQDKKRAEQKRNQKWYSCEEILALISKADPQWKAMILLGINGAMEPIEISLLDWSDVDLEHGWRITQ